MNELKKRTSEGLSEFFTVETTKTFQIEMNKALKQEMSLSEIMRVLIKYGVMLKPKVKEFLEGYHHMMESWQQEGQGSEVVGELTTSESRFIACLLGQRIAVYEFEYKHASAKKPLNYVIHGYKFGMM